MAALTQDLIKHSGPTPGPSISKKLIWIRLVWIGLNLKIGYFKPGYVILILVKLGYGFGNPILPRIQIKCCFWVFQNSKVEIRIVLMPKIRIILILLEGWITHGVKVDVERCKDIRHIVWCTNADRQATEGYGHHSLCFLKTLLDNRTD